MIFVYFTFLWAIQSWSHFLSRAYDVYMYVLIISSENNLFISSYNYIEIGITGLIWKWLLILKWPMIKQFEWSNICVQ